MSLEGWLWVMSVLALLLAVAVGLGLTGILREIVTLRRQVVGLEKLITQPPEPSWVGDGDLPVVLREALESVRESPSVLLFVDDGCPSCKQVLRAIADHPLRGEILAHVAVVLMRDALPDRPSPFVELVESLGVQLLVDEGGWLRAAASVYGAPTAIAWDGVTVHYLAGAGLDWIVEQTRLVPTTVSRN